MLQFFSISDYFKMQKINFGLIIEANLINTFKISLTHTFCTFITTGGVKDEPQISATTPAKIIKNTTNVDQDEIE